MGNSQNKRASVLRARRKRRAERIKDRIKAAKSAASSSKKRR
jgi:hypothetical protein